LGIGGLKSEKQVVNNLHRELAPISDAAWDQIEGVTAHQRQAQLMVDFRISFTVTRAAVDDVDRGAAGSDWQRPVEGGVGVNHRLQFRDRHFCVDRECEHRENLACVGTYGGSTDQGPSLGVGGQLDGTGPGALAMGESA
jgi:hypothetical protein